MPRLGWSLVQEPRPSLCAHWMPTDDGHALTNTCWCKPSIQNEANLNPPYTIVHHNRTAFVA